VKIAKWHSPSVESLKSKGASRRECLEQKLKSKLRLAYRVIKSPLFFEKIGLSMGDGTILTGSTLGQMDINDLVKTYLGKQVTTFVYVAFTDGSTGMLLEL
jgi:hypothetical protein